LIIKSIKEKNKNNSILVIDDKEYILSTDIVVEYFLFKGKEINIDTLNEIISLNDEYLMFNKMKNYLLRYQANEKKIRMKLIDNNISFNSTNNIIERLIKIGLLNDDKFIDSFISSLIRKGNGENLIRQKLFDKGFENNLISLKLKDIRCDEYYEALNKMYNKALKNYKEDEGYQKVQKVKKYLLSRGYTYQDINDIS
jgi:regulatory protein